MRWLQPALVVHSEAIGREALDAETSACHHAPSPPKRRRPTALRSQGLIGVACELGDAERAETPLRVGIGYSRRTKSLAALTAA